MSTSCGCFRFWLDDDEGQASDSLEQQARAEHLRTCPDCREEMRGIVEQRATVRGVFRALEVEPALSEATVMKWVSAMVRAVRKEEEPGRSVEQGSPR